MNKYVIALDQGTTSSRAIVFDCEGRIVSVSIPDPKGENKETYIHTVRALRAWLEILFPYILKDLGAEKV